MSVSGDDAPPAPGEALEGLTPAARRALTDRFLAEAPGLVRDALAAAAAADHADVARLGDALAADAATLGLGELAAAAAALSLAARAGGDDVPPRLVGLVLAWDAAGAALGRARP